MGSASGGPGTQAIRVDGSTVTPVPGLAGSDYDSAYGINEAGTTVVGGSFFSGGDGHGWVNDGTTTAELPTLGGDYTIAIGVDASGLIAGISRTPDGKMHLVTWQDGSITDIGAADYGSANVIEMTDAGLILASFSIFGTGDRVGIWNGSALIDIGTLGGSSTYPGSMNVAGHAS